MRRALVQSSAVALCALCAAALAQAQKPAAEPAPAREPARLNLKLDKPAQFYTREPLAAPEAGAEKSGAADLPALGAGARPLEPPAPPRPEFGSSPFPKNTEVVR